MPTLKESQARTDRIVSANQASLTRGLQSFLKSLDAQKKDARAQEAHDLSQQIGQLRLQGLQQEASQREQAQASKDAFLQGQMGNLLHQGAQLWQQGPQTPQRADRFGAFGQILNKVKDPAMRQSLAQEFAAQEERAFAQQGAQDFAGQIQDDLAIGNLGEPDAMAPEIQGLLQGLDQVQTPEELLQIQQDYEGLKQSLVEQSKKVQFKEWGLSRIQRDMAGVEGDPEASQSLMDVMARWQHGDIKDGASLEKALRYARAGLAPDEISLVEQMRQRKSAFDQLMGEQPKDQFDEQGNPVLPTPPNDQQIAERLRLLTPPEARKPTKSGGSTEANAYRRAAKNLKANPTAHDILQVLEDNHITPSAEAINRLEMLAGKGGVSGASK